jgi:hypothetical protein
MYVFTKIKIIKEKELEYKKYIFLYFSYPLNNNINDK